MNQFVCEVVNSGVIGVGELFRVGPTIYVCDKFEVLDDVYVRITGHEFK